MARISELWGSLPRFSQSNSLERTGPPETRAYQHTAIIEGKAVGRYTPPTPTYALSAADAIPPGFVIHARNACVEVDYQWNSIAIVRFNVTPLGFVVPKVVVLKEGVWITR